MKIGVRFSSQARWLQVLARDARAHILGVHDANGTQRLRRASTTPSFVAAQTLLDVSCARCGLRIGWPETLVGRSLSLQRTHVSLKWGFAQKSCRHSDNVRALWQCIGRQERTSGKKSLCIDVNARHWSGVFFLF